MRLRLILWTTVLLAMVAGCGRGQPPEGSSTPTEHGTDATATGSAAPPATSSARCGPHTLTATTQGQPAPLCLTVGASVHITTQQSPHQPWSLPTSSDESVVRCVGQHLENGAAEATCTALRTGTAIVTTATAPFAGDPHGPPQSHWELHVTVA